MKQLEEELRVLDQTLKSLHASENKVAVRVCVCVYALETLY